MPGQIGPPAQPPGPRGIPFLGNLVEFRRDAPGFLARLARDYGDVARFRLGSQEAWQLSHPDLIRDVLVTHSGNFEKTRVLNRAKRVIGEGLLSSNGSFHRRQRRLVQPAFQKQRIAAYASIMTDCARKHSDRWRDGDEVDMFAEMLRLTLSVVGHTLFGVDIETSATEVGRAMTVAFEYFNSLMLPFAGLLDRLPLPAKRRFEEARELLDRKVYSIIEQRRAEGRDRGDLLSMLLLAVDEENGSSMPDRQVRDEIMTMFLAGHETTATMLTWTWYLLAANPQAESELHAEMARVLAGRAPTVDDLPRLEYLRMVLAESMRLYPPVWTLTRRAVADYPVGPYVIPAGAIVGMSQWVMHRDPRYYSDPERFEPRRWLPEAAAARPKYCYFPFGGGPRLCVGEPFAWMEASLLLATLCQAWQPRLVRPGEPELQPLITLRPRGGLPMRLVVRTRESDETAPRTSHEVPA